MKSALCSLVVLGMLLSSAAAAPAKRWIEGRPEEFDQGKFDNVALIESKEYRSKKKKEDTDEESDGLTFRRFRLAAMLRKEVRLTQEDVKRIAYGSNTAP